MNFSIISFMGSSLIRGIYCVPAITNRAKTLPPGKPRENRHAAVCNPGITDSLVAEFSHKLLTTLGYITGTGQSKRAPAFSELFVREPLALRRLHLELARFHNRSSRRHIRLRNPILPSETIFIPQRPQKPQHHRSARKKVPKTAPQQLPRVGQAAVQPHDRKLAKLHSRRSSRKSGEQKKILRVKKVESREIYDCVHFFQHQLAAE